VFVGGYVEGMAVASDDDSVPDLSINCDDELGHEGLQVVAKFFGVLLCPPFDSDRESL
jgi:hypothetical protein